MNVLVTGATGFIGNYVIEELLNYGCQLTATSTSQKKACKSDWFDKVSFVPYSFDQVSDNENLYKLFNEPDLVIHLAWAGLPNYNELHHINKTLFEQFRFISNLIENGVKDILITGTCLEYGMQSGSLHEALIPQPGNAYAIAKDSLRKFVEVIQTKRHFYFKWVRLFYMYGKGQGGHSLIPMLEKAEANGEFHFKMSLGEQLRDYLPVEKVASIICKIAFQNEVNGIINCCSGVPISVRRLVEEYIANNRFKIKPDYGHYPYPGYEPLAFWGNDNKLKLILQK